jgi:hypothetical protein
MAHHRFFLPPGWVQCGEETFEVRRVVGRSSVREYHICTLVTDTKQYQTMKSSFLSAGFDEARCLYTVFDNTLSNQWDPYAVISSVLAGIEDGASGDRPRYIIFCHQDVQLDQGHGINELTTALKALEVLDSKWAVAGNGGVTDGLKTIRHISDPFGISFMETLPARVLTLDENLLIVKPGTGLRCSPEMSGFHLYGTDLCLNALMRGYRAYVVDFKLTHLSRGNVDEVFYAVLQKLQAAWNRRFIGALVASPCITFVLSRFAPVSSVLSRSRTANFFRSHPRLSAFLITVNRMFFGRQPA